MADTHSADFSALITPQDDPVSFLDISNHPVNTSVPLPDFERLFLGNTLSPSNATLNTAAPPTSYRHSYAGPSRPVRLASSTSSSQRRQDSLAAPATLSVSAMVPLPPQVEVTVAAKDADDPNSSPDRRRSTIRDNPPTSTALNRLFALQGPSPATSRATSYNTQAERSPYVRTLFQSTAPLANHLYSRGLLEGRFSDVNIIAFGTRYPLHRIVLDRAPYFSSAFSGPWSESTAKDIPVYPEEIDPYITQTAFELALKRLYGCHDASEEQYDAVSLFCTGSWLEMRDLVEDSTENLLQALDMQNLPSIVSLVTSNFYGKPGDKILTAAKAMVNRAGYSLPLKAWDKMPGDFVGEAIAGDSFFVPSESERYELAKRLLNRRLKKLARESHVAGWEGRVRLEPSEEFISEAIKMPDGTVELDDALSAQDDLAPWIAIYNDPSIVPISFALENRIHYPHMSFEELQQIKTAVDIFGLPVVSEKKIMDALWLNMELRHCVVNAKQKDLELKLTTQPIAPAMSIREKEKPHLKSRTNSELHSTSPFNGKGKVKCVKRSTSDTGRLVSINATKATPDLSNHYLIPTTDRSISSTGAPLSEAGTMSASLGTSQSQSSSYQHVPASHRRSSGKTSVSTRPDSSSSSSSTVTPTFTRFPPFRFAVEFPNPSTIKERKRIYSRTVFYAGSYWNLYVHKVRSSTNKLQLGFYLHRAEELPFVASSDLPSTACHTIRSSVDERIGVLEREMLLRSSGGRQSISHRAALASAIEGASLPGRHGHHGHHGRSTHNDNEDSEGGDLEATLVASPSGTLSTSGPRPEARIPVASASTSASARHRRYRPDTYLSASEGRAESESSADDSSATTSTATMKPKGRRGGSGGSGGARGGGGGGGVSGVPTLPPYIDTRPTVKAYFKIWCPGKGGRVLSVYESRPDKFNFCQSWGWRSSTLLGEEGWSWSGGEEAAPRGHDGVGSVGDGGSGSGSGSDEIGSGSGSGSGSGETLGSEEDGIADGRTWGLEDEDSDEEGKLGSFEEEDDRTRRGGFGVGAGVGVGVGVGGWGRRAARDRDVVAGG